MISKFKFSIWQLSMASLLFGACQEPPKQEEQELDPIEFHQAITTIDSHIDFHVDYFTDTLNYTHELDIKVDLPKMERGGLDVPWLVVYTAQGDLTPEGYAAALKNANAKFDAIDRLVNRYAPNRIALATSSKEMDSIIQTGKKAAMIGVENAYSIGLDTSNIRKFYERGARYLSLSHNGHNQLSDSQTGDVDGVYLHNGISELGKQVIELCNYYGIILDISHPSDESIRQTIKHSKAPVIASHSSVRALSDNSRNLSDELLELVRDNGGVVQAVALHYFVNKEKRERFTSARDSILAIDPNTDIETIKEQFPPVDVADYIDHIDYMVEKMGIDHVGISSDFDGGGEIEGWNDASETHNVTLELLARGYSQDEIRKIWGGNLMRVLDEVQEISRSLQSQ
ncbi:MAG: dipeptidase [Flavobacteriaceae bacterium]|nr:dipeptidase [Flavobacteriaceae bacterium]